MDRNAQRQQAQNNRNLVDPKQLSKRICRRLTKTRLFVSARRIAVYLPTGNEVDTEFLISAAWARKKLVYAPFLTGSQHQPMLFAPLHPRTTFMINRFGIQEPNVHPSLLVRPRQLDLVVAPLVAFDSACHRLGMGGGYYDRCFAFRNRCGHLAKPCLVGIAYESQRLDHITTTHWDVCLDAVVTETRVYAVSHA